jgi:hypothetical protein
MRTALLAMSLCVTLSTFAQEIDYTKVSFTHQTLPTLTQYSDYKTFDVTVLTTKEEADKPGTGFNLPYQVKLGNLTQADSAADFHVISLLQRFNGKMTSASTATVNIALTTTVYDRFGVVVKTASIVNEAYPVNFGRELKKEESANRLIMEKVIEASLKPLSDALFGATLQPILRLASLDDVKKLPALKQFEEQVKTMKPALEKGGLTAFKTAAEPYVAYWQENAAYTGENAEDVKRAALHNLAFYYIAANDNEKAMTYIEQYKPIDKVIKELMGLVKYKNSEELEKFMLAISPAAEASVVTGGNVKSTAAIVDAHRFLIIDGTVKLNGKKNAGSYNGVIRVNKIPSGSFGNIASLDPENITVTVQTKDASGQPVTINTSVSQIEDLKAADGTGYITEKFGTAMLGDGSYYTFMQSTYTSPKITVYRSILPAGNTDYVVRKSGDTKGVKSTLLNARKNLLEYLADCPAIAEKIKNSGVSVEKIAEEYSNCK